LKAAEDKEVALDCSVLTKLFIPVMQSGLVSPPAAHSGEFLVYSATARVAPSREAAVVIKKP
jgi:hypothetical protein